MSDSILEFTSKADLVATCISAPPDEEGRLGIPVSLVGPPGSGKTSMMRHFSRVLDRPMNLRELSQLEASDVGGPLDRADYKGTKVFDHSPLRWHAEVSEWESQGKNPLIFLDDFAAADEATQQATLGFAENRAVGNYTFKRTSIVLASNFATLSARNRLPTNVANRYVHIHMGYGDDAKYVAETGESPLHVMTSIEAMQREWSSAWTWAVSMKREFAREHSGADDLYDDEPSMIRNWTDYAYCSPRSLDRMARCLAAARITGVDDTDLVRGSVGTRVAELFDRFRMEVRMLSVADVLAGNFNVRSENCGTLGVALRNASLEVSDLESAQILAGRLAEISSSRSDGCAIVGAAVSTFLARMEGRDRDVKTLPSDAALRNEMTKVTLAVAQGQGIVIPSTRGLSR